MAKGTMYILVAQLVFMASGYVIHFGLGRLLGPELYGVYGVMLSLITLTTIVLTAGIPQAVSKYVSEGKDPEAVRKEAMKLQMVFAGIFFIAYLLLADYIAQGLNDSSLVWLVRLTSIVLIPYAFYSIYTGYLNGLKRFGTQAKLTVLYSIAKVAGVFTFVLIGLKVAGAIIGFAMAPLLAGLAAFVLFRKGSKTSFGSGKIISFAAPLAIIALATTAITSIDILAVKAFTTSAEAGYYTAASMISKVILVLAAALTATLFPSISASTSSNDKALTRTYITKSIRYTLMFLAPITVLFFSTSSQLISLIYTSSFIQGGAALQILAVGITLFSMFSVLSAIISGSGKPHITMLILLLAVTADIILNVSLVPNIGITGAAWATTISSLVAFLLSGIYVAKRFRVLADFKSVIRIGIASVITFYASSFINFSGILLIAEYAMLAGIYFITLFITREISREDFEVASKIPVIGYLFRQEKK